MALFSNNKQVSGSSGRVNVFGIDYPFDRSSWLDVFSACAGRSFIVQERFAQLIVRDRDWFVDFSAQTLSFGDDAFPVQFIGSESSVSSTWMWGWNNVNNFEPQLISLVSEVHKLGELWQLQPLTEMSFELSEDLNAHTLAIVATGICKGDHCYYIGPHDNGSAVMAVPVNDPRVFAPVSIGEFIQWIMSAIQKFDLDHRIFTESLLLWNGTPFERDGSKLIAYFPEQRLRIDLEKTGGTDRITNIKTI